MKNTMKSKITINNNFYIEHLYKRKTEYVEKFFLFSIFFRKVHDIFIKCHRIGNVRKII